MTTSDPIFWPLAGRLAMAMSMVPCDGSRGLRGTCTVAHWYLAGPADPVQGAQFTTCAGNELAGLVVVDVEDEATCEVRVALVQPAKAASDPTATKTVTRPVRTAAEVRASCPGRQSPRGLACSGWPTLHWPVTWTSNEAG